MLAEAYEVRKEAVQEAMSYIFLLWIIQKTKKSLLLALRQRFEPAHYLNCIVNRIIGRFWRASWLSSVPARKYLTGTAHKSPQ